LTRTGQQSRAGNRRQALFNPRVFARQLARNPSPISCFKASIKQAHILLDERFRSGDKIESLIKDISWFTDQILIQAWKRYDWGDATDISLVAVGGYGRGELHPYSDIDIQIMLKRNNLRRHTVAIEGFLTFLWDINLEVGQSVRTIRENLLHAAKDITITTALLESRTICGNPALQQEVMTRLFEKKVWKPKRYFAAKKA
jgi:[protein-PII] uridylyltransferase